MGALDQIVDRWHHVGASGGDVDLPSSNGALDLADLGRLCRRWWRDVVGKKFEIATASERRELARRDECLRETLECRSAHDADSALSQKIAMTAPVTVIPADDNLPIEVTTPAPATYHGLVQSIMSARRWRIHFVLPRRYRMSVLPRPNNPAVTVRDVPAKRYAVVKFSGLAGAEKLQQKTAQLFGWLNEKKYPLIGLPQLARYDPPWTLPFFRRNEVMVEIDASLKGRRTEPVHFSLRT